MPNTEQDDILDPAHRDDGGIQTAVAGMGREEPKQDEIKASEDGNLLEKDGKKYVREEALHEERTARQKLSSTLRQLEPLMPEFQEFLKGGK